MITMEKKELVELLKDPVIRRLAVIYYVFDLPVNETMRDYCLAKSLNDIDPFCPYKQIDKPRNIKEFADQFKKAFWISLRAQRFGRKNKVLDSATKDMELWLEDRFKKIEDDLNINDLTLPTFYAAFWKDVDFGASVFNKKVDTDSPSTAEQLVKAFRKSFERFKHFREKKAALFTKFVIYFFNLFSDKEKYIKFLEVPSDTHVKAVVKNVWNLQQTPSFDMIQKCATSLYTYDKALLPIDLDLVMPLRSNITPALTKALGASDNIVALHRKLCKLPALDRS